MKKTLFNRIWIAIIAVVLLTVSFTGCSDEESNLQGSVINGNIPLVKNGTPMLIPDITYGEAYENFFSDPKWRGFEAEDGREIVEFSGGCTYMDEDAVVYIQFTLEEDDSFYINYASLTVDGEEFDADDQTYFELAYDPFEAYANEVLGKELDEEVRDAFAEAFYMLY